jgi:iron-sulfur cluster assembly protein
LFLKNVNKKCRYGRLKLTKFAQAIIACMSNNSPISFSASAHENLLALVLEGKMPEPFLRIGMRGGTCGGSYVLGFDQKTAFDEEYLISQIPVVIDKRQLLFVLGTEISFEPSANGFYLHKPSSSL